MILVTGGAGYIGSHFVKTYLSNNDEKLVVVDDLSEGHHEALDFSDNIVLVRENTGNTEALKQTFRDFPISAVVHFAASCYVEESQRNPGKYFNNNVINTLKLLEVMEDSGVRRIVFSSTCATYGIPKVVPLTETNPLEPINTYGLTKVMAEKALETYANRLGWTYIALRYFNVAGADESGLIGESHRCETHLIPLVLQTALGKQPELKIYGDDYDTPDGTCIRDYINVTDLANAHCLALSKLDAIRGGEAINIGTTHGASVKQIIETCQNVTGKQVPLQIAQRRPGDPPVLVADTTKASKLLGWQVQHDLEATIASAWKWEQNRRY